jgi:hypothetical protein
LGLLSAETLLAGASAEQMEGAAARADALVEGLQMIGKALYLHEEAILHWRIEQSYEQGENRCLGETLKNEILGRATPDPELLWDRHVRRRFNFGDLRTIVVKPDIKPQLYMAAERMSATPDGYTVTISTPANDIAIEYYGFDGGDVVAEDAPLFFTNYYLDLFVIGLQTARDVAASLQARAAECGAADVELLDLTR